MPVNWKDPDAFTRLLAAMVAAQDMKLDYRKIASMYGNGATYDSIEGRFRIIKKDAAALKAEIDTGTRPQAPARSTATKKPTPSTPKKDKTLAGRVGKTNLTPVKKRATVKGIKAELDSRYDESSFMDVSSTEMELQGVMVVGGGASSSQGAGGVEYDRMDLEAF